MAAQLKHCTIILHRVGETMASVYRQRSLSFSLRSQSAQRHPLPRGAVVMWLDLVGLLMRLLICWRHHCGHKCYDAQGEGQPYIAHYSTHPNASASIPFGTIFVA
jgi:hypothetical protein